MLCFFMLNEKGTAIADHPFGFYTPVQSNAKWVQIGCVLMQNMRTL
jgi:hypothetical protein